MTELTNRTAELAPGGGLDIRGVSSFGEDARGEIYFCDWFDGEVFKIVANPTGVAPGAGPGAQASASGLVIGEVAPQPARDGFRFSYAAPAGARVSASLVDASGRLVRGLFQERLASGHSAAIWDGRDDQGVRVPAGVYFLRIATGERVASRRVTVVR